MDISLLYPLVYNVLFDGLADPGRSLPSLATAIDPDLAAAAPLVLAVVLLSLIVIYLASKVGGEVCQRFGLPTVLGELVAGALIGISVCHWLVFPESGATAADSGLIQVLSLTTDAGPALLDRVFDSASEIIAVLSELGVIILLFEIGLESNLTELIKVGPQAAIVAVVGVAVPFALGTGGLIALFGVDPVPAIFAGAALTATSIGITAKVLAELQRLNTTEGQIIIGAAVLDDILGIIVLAVVASLAKEGTVAVNQVLILIASATVFLIGAIVLGRLLMPAFVGLVDRLQTRGQLLVSSIVLVAFLSYLGAAVQLEAILGSFAAGLILAETNKREELEAQVLPLADLLVPIFFVVVGARTNLSVLNPFDPVNRQGLIMALFLVAVAIAGKLVTGLTVFGKPGANRVAIGVGMIPRGEVGLVFAGVGAASGVLSDALDAAIIVMVIVTTFLAPPLLRAAFQLPSSGDGLVTTDPSSSST